jgi:hypothetical protein
MLPFLWDIEVIFDLLHKSFDVRERLLRKAYCALSSALLQEVY